MKELNIAFIGAGNMSGSIIGGMVKGGYSPDKITASNPSTPKLDKLHADFGINITTDNLEAIRNSDIIVLGVKPQMMEAVCSNIATLGDTLKNKLFVSLAVGITACRLQSLLQKNVAMIRCMPNTPSLYSLGVSGLYSVGASDEQKAFATRMFEPVGLVVWVDTEQGVDAVAAVSGSGPAYYFLFMEGMVKKAMQLGFDEETASKMVQQTALGAAHMATQSTDSIPALRSNVTSKGGTTAAALASFQQSQLEDIIDTAMQSACERAAELAKELG